MLFAGKYELLEPLGEGAMGVVYRARHSLLDVQMAVKVLRPQYSADESFRKRFLREARSVMAFVHKRSVTLRDFGESEDGALYLAMDLCPGIPLTQVLSRANRLDPVRACLIAMQVLEVLDEAHAAGLLHRDIKPDNIMVDGRAGSDQIKVMDFGIARLMEGDADQTNLTAGNAIGTPLYMSPEQAAGERCDTRSDLYSVGIVLYELLTGQPPFKAERVQALLMKHLTQPVPAFPAELGLDPTLERIIVRALAKTAEARFASAQAFLEALTSWVELARSKPLSETVGFARSSVPLEGAEVRDGGAAFSAGNAHGRDGASVQLRVPAPLPPPLKHIRPSSEREDDEEEPHPSIKFVRPASELGQTGEVPPATSVPLSGQGSHESARQLHRELEGSRPPSRRELSREYPLKEYSRADARGESDAAASGVSERDLDWVEPESPPWRQPLLWVLGALLTPLLLGMGWLLAAEEVPEPFIALAERWPGVTEALVVLPGYARLSYLLEPPAATPLPLPTATAAPAPTPTAEPKQTRPSRPPKGKKSSTTGAASSPSSPMPPKPAAGTNPTVVLSASRDELWVRSPHFLLEGPVPLGGDRATLDGIPIYVRTGRFLATLTLQPGENRAALTGYLDGNSSTRTLTLHVDTVPPVVTLEQPKRRDRILRARLPLSGRVREENLSYLQLNGKNIPVKDGTFEVEVVLDPGPNRLVLVAEDLAGNQSREELTLTHVSSR